MEQIFVVTRMEGQLGVIQGDIVIEINGQPPLGGQVGQFPAGYGENFQLP